MAEEEKAELDVEILEGHQAFAARAIEMLGSAYKEAALMTQELDARIYATEDFVTTARKFVLQHHHTRFRILVNRTQQAIRGGSRFVEFARALTSHVEFRELPQARRSVIRDEYLITDGGLLLYRETPEDLEARYYGHMPLAARERLRVFDNLWNESTVAQELRKLHI